MILSRVLECYADRAYTYANLYWESYTYVFDPKIIDTEYIYIFLITINTILDHIFCMCGFNYTVNQ